MKKVSLFVLSSVILLSSVPSFSFGENSGSQIDTAVRIPEPWSLKDNDLAVRIPEPWSSKHELAASVRIPEPWSLKDNDLTIHIPEPWSAKYTSL